MSDSPRSNASDAPGSVSLVGAGPGADDLLTLRALNAIETADVVFYDSLVGEGVLARIPAQARRVFVGKRKGYVSVPQEEIQARLAEEARAGHHVVRLKGGDPFIFGRGGEEADDLKAAGITVTVIPGITAALGAAADHAVPLTHRDLATSVTFVTAHRARGQADLAGLFAQDRTLVVYMGLSSAPAVVAQLTADGAPNDWPVLVVENATHADQRSVPSTLATLEQDLAEQDVVSPALLIIGPVTDPKRRNASPNTAAAAAHSG